MPQVKHAALAAIALGCVMAPAQQSAAQAAADKLTEVEAYYYVLRHDSCHVKGVARTAAKVEEIRNTVTREAYNQEMAYKRVKNNAGPAHCVAEQVGHLLSGVPMNKVQDKINDRLEGRK